MSVSRGAPNVSVSLRQWLGSKVPAGPLSGDLAVAADAALAGGQAAMSFYGRDDLSVRDKGIDDPVTAADRAANDAILGVLAERVPGQRVLSEESPPPPARPSGAGTEGERLWIVDPLDGTKEFLARNGEFAIMVGLAVAGRSALGAVYQPDPDLLYLGLAGGGAWLVAEARQRPAARELAVPAGRNRPFRLVASRSHGDPAIERLIEALGEVEVSRSGSVGIKCALIARGEADLYVHPVPYLKEWDTCAPEAVLKGAGGRVTDCGGKALRYGKEERRQSRGIFAGTPAAWQTAGEAVGEAAAGLLVADP